jgi:hypothetical protein
MIIVYTLDIFNFANYADILRLKKFQIEIMLFNLY